LSPVRQAYECPGVVCVTVNPTENASCPIPGEDEVDLAATIIDDALRTVVNRTAAAAATL
jgi:hypothetical protein